MSVIPVIDLNNQKLLNAVPAIKTPFTYKGTDLIQPTKSIIYNIKANAHIRWTMILIYLI